MYYGIERNPVCVGVNVYRYQTRSMGFPRSKIKETKTAYMEKLYITK